MERTINIEVGLKFKPTFASYISYFEVRGFGDDGNTVLTTAHPRFGKCFEYSIELQCLDAGFLTGEYKVCG